MADDERPIIIKKIKKGGHDAHGGAWKVAYADFVTAMMAFFLLLWLLSSTSEDQREGIADYFTPTVGVRDEMGIGFEGGTTPNSDGTKKSDLSPPGIIYGAPPTGELIKDPDQIEKDYEEETQQFEKIEAEIIKKIKEDPALGEFADNLLIEQTPEGLKIQLVDQHDQQMFKAGSTRLEEHAKKILKMLAPILDSMPNRMSIAGHTDAKAYGINVTYGNWELSADRANATRRYFRDHTDLTKDKVVVVHGKASREPLLPHDRTNPRNRRISMILLHKSIYPFDVPITEELNKAPSPNDPTPNLNLVEPSLNMPEPLVKKEEKPEEAPSTEASPDEQSPGAE